MGGRELGGLEGRPDYGRGVRGKACWSSLDERRRAGGELGGPDDGRGFRGEAHWLATNGVSDEGREDGRKARLYTHEA